jgi:S-adenosylmethionine decarboxylase
LFERIVQTARRTGIANAKPFAYARRRYPLKLAGSALLAEVLLLVHPMLIVGTEWLIDAAGCRAEALRDVETLRGVFARIVGEMGLHVLGEARWHVFAEPGGVTGLALLSESHLACHTYPEFGVATFNLYCCRARPAWAWEERLREMLGASLVGVRVVERSVWMEAETTHELRQTTGDELRQTTTARLASDTLQGGEQL